jgi:hypothetical protein
VEIKEEDSLDEDEEMNGREEHSCYTPSKKSFIVSDYSHRKSVERTKIAAVKMHQGNKIKYHKNNENKMQKSNSLYTISPSNKQKMTVSPNYKRKLNFSNMYNYKFTLGDEEIIKERNFTKEDRSPRNNSTRNTTCNAITTHEEERPRKINNIRENNTSRKTIIHCHNEFTGQKKIKRISTLTNMSQFHSNRKRGYLETIYNKTETSRSNISSNLY